MKKRVKQLQNRVQHLEDLWVEHGEQHENKVKARKAKRLERKRKVKGMEFVWTCYNIVFYGQSILLSSQIERLLFICFGSHRPILGYICHRSLNTMEMGDSNWASSRDARS